MKTIYLVLVLFVGSFFFISCDSFLDNDSPSGLPEDMAYDSMENCERALNGVYRSMYNYVVGMPALYDVAVDDIKYTRWGDNSYSSIRVFVWSTGTFGASSSPWGFNYSMIDNANRLLVGIQKFENSGDEDVEAQVKRIKGETLMLRAFAHFELLRTYGYKYNKTTAGSDKGIPIVWESNRNAKPRESVAKSLELIFEDLKAAETYMTAVKDIMDNRANAVCYFSLDALRALETRIYLYMEDYRAVITAAGKIVGYGITDDQTKFNSFWANDNNESREAIYMIGISSLEASTGLSLAEGLYLRDKSTDGNSRANFIPATELMSLYNKTSDIRWQAYFTENYPMHSSTGADNVTLVTKYPGNSAISKTDKINQTKYFRYAEVVLNKIEALYYEDPTLALSELNAFRKKRIAGYIDETHTGQALLDEIKLERRREFAFEGMRFHDLRRWNEGFKRETQSYVLPSEIITVSGIDYKWVLPIPQHEMDANSLPADYQNPGY